MLANFGEAKFVQIFTIPVSSPARADRFPPLFCLHAAPNPQASRTITGLWYPGLPHAPGAIAPDPHGQSKPPDAKAWCANVPRAGYSDSDLRLRPEAVERFRYAQPGLPQPEPDVSPHYSPCAAICEHPQPDPAPPPSADRSPPHAQSGPSPSENSHAEPPHGWRCPDRPRSRKAGRSGEAERRIHGARYLSPPTPGLCCAKPDRAPHRESPSRPQRYSSAKSHAESDFPR